MQLQLMMNKKVSPPPTNHMPMTKQKTRAKKFLFLRVSTHTFAIPLSSVREVLGLGQISVLPNMPIYFAGLINLRGKIISAVDLKKCLTFLTSIGKDPTSKRPCVVITEIQGRMFGAIADDVVEVLAIGDELIDNSIDGLENKEVFTGVIKRDGSPLAPILNLERALKIDELIVASQLHKIES